MTSTVPRWHVFGLGRVGTPLASALHEHGGLATTWTRSQTGRDRSADADLPAPSPSLTVEDSVTHVLIAVPDDVITRFCAALDAHARSNPDRIWLHTSGSLGAEALRTAGVQGHVGSCHPLQSMTGNSTDLARLRGAFFAVEGDPKAIDAASDLARMVGGEPHELKSEDKIAYHCAAVLASNGVYALLSGATSLAQTAGIGSAALDQSLARLAQQSAVNALAGPLSVATTGPVVRGDAGTVRAHLQHLRLGETQATTEALYRAIARELLRIAESGDTRPASLAAVAAVLDDAET